eukprot:3658948-Prymnesium_polylepis.1
MDPPDAVRRARSHEFMEVDHVTTPKEATHLSILGLVLGFLSFSGTWKVSGTCAGARGAGSWGAALRRLRARAVRFGGGAARIGRLL